MKLHTIHRTQRLPATLEQVWDFFADPHVVMRLTPPPLAFEITNDPPPRMEPGAVVAHRFRPLPGLSMGWLTEVTRAHAPYFYVEVLRAGPFRLWHHQHRFRAVKGGVEVEDLVTYALPVDLPAGPLHRYVVRPRLERIFAYRREALERNFGPWPPGAARARRAGRAR